MQTITKAPQIKTAQNAFDWIAELLNPAIADGSVYWVTASTWCHPYWIIAPKNGCWLRASINHNSNEAYHLVLSCKIRWGGSLNDPEWFTIATAKVWDLANAGKLAGMILMAAVDI